MDIPSFHDPIIEKIAQLHTLKDLTLVIDAHNFFYDWYKKSGLRYNFGAECDQYAKHVKRDLEKFKNANLTCFFVFKGGAKEYETTVKGNIEPSQTMQNHPMFMYDIHMQVLEELKFKYVFTEYECKLDCISLARELSCPVISNDTEFLLSGVQYIPKSSIKLDEDPIPCRLFSLEKFLKDFELNKDKVALFVLLTDLNIFPKETFYGFFKSIDNRRLKFKDRNMILLKWLSNNTVEDILTAIRRHTTKIGGERIDEELDKVKKYINGDVGSNIAIDYFTNRRQISDWFTNGVAANHVAMEYINMYRSKKLVRTTKENDFKKLSLNITKYAYDLLTGFKNDGLEVIYYNLDSDEIQTIKITKTVKKPISQADQIIFQNGWGNNISSSNLFQHFISEMIPLDGDTFKKVPNDAKMLMITLVYIFHDSHTPSNKVKFTNEMAYGVLLCYVMLHVKERVEIVDKDKPVVTESHCEVAENILDGYFKVDNVCEKMDKDLLVSLKQIQFCLLEMNNLNKLCGSSFEPTTYRKTYNGTFVYMVIYTMRDEGIITSIERILKNAPTVLTYFRNIVKLYHNLIKK